MRTPILLLLNLSYLMIVSVVNSEISPYVALVLPSIFIIPPALFLRLVPMSIVVSISALLFEAFTDSRDCLICGIWLGFALFVRTIRFRFRSMDKFSLTALFEVINFAVILLYMLFLPKACDGILDYLLRVFTDSLLSAAVLLFIGAYIVALPLSFFKVLKLSEKLSEDES